MKPSRQHLTLLIISFCICLVVGAAYVYMYQAVGISVTHAAAARSIVSTQKLSEVQEKKTMELYTETQSDRARLYSFFVPDSDVVSFIETLENLGPQAGSTVTVSAINAEDTTGMRPGSFAKISGHVDVNGSWAAVMRTLMLAESLPIRSTVSKVSFSMSGTLDEKNPRHAWSVIFDVTGDIVVGSSTAAH